MVVLHMVVRMVLPLMEGAVELIMYGMAVTALPC